MSMERHHGLMVSVLISRFKPRLGALCCVLGQDTFIITVPISTQVYKGYQQTYAGVN